MHVYNYCEKLVEVSYKDIFYKIAGIYIFAMFSKKKKILFSTSPYFFGIKSQPMLFWASEIEDFFPNR